MTISRRSANVALVAFLAVAVIGAGIVGYNAQIQADTITPGFATAKVIMQITVPEANDISINASFFPTDTRISKYYFKNRVFAVKPGINLVNWYIKKIPGGTYKASIKSNIASFQPSEIAITLLSDEVTNTEKFVMDLGMPAPISEEEMPEPTEAPQDATNPNSPPVPSLDMSPTSNTTTVPSASATATERVPDEGIPSIPSLPI